MGSKSRIDMMGKWETVEMSVERVRKTQNNGFLTEKSQNPSVRQKEPSRWAPVVVASSTLSADCSSEGPTLH